MTDRFERSARVVAQVNGLPDYPFAVIGHPVANDSDEALRLKAGDEIEVHVAGARQFAVARRPGRAGLLKRLRAFRGRLPADFRFDREEANAR